MAPKKRKLADENDGGTAKKAKTTTAPRSVRITRSMKTDGPRQAVFNTAELLESILLELPMKQLFPIRRVSQQFHDCVNASIKLQERMFLRPRSAKKEVWTLRTLEPHRADSWLSNRKCEFAPSSDSITNVVKNAQNLQPASLNPTISHGSCGSAVANQRVLHAMHNAEEVVILDDLTKWFTHPGTWRDMYLTDPPCTNASIFLRLQLNTHPSADVQPKSDMDICDPNGLTFGTLTDVFMEKTQELNVYVFPDDHGIRTNSISAIVSGVQDTKKKGHMIKKSFARLRLKGVVIASPEEREEVRRRSVAAGYDTA